MKTLCLSRLVRLIPIGLLVLVVSAPQAHSCTWIMDPDYPKYQLTAGGDEDGWLYVHGVKCGERWRKCEGGVAEVYARVWVLAVVGDATTYKEHELSCTGWVALNGKIKFTQIDGGSGSLYKPAGKYADTYNHSTCYYEFFAQDVGSFAEAKAKYYDRCYYMHTTPALLSPAFDGQSDSDGDS